MKTPIIIMVSTLQIKPQIQCKSDKYSSSTCGGICVYVCVCVCVNKLGNRNLRTGKTILEKENRLGVFAL